MKWIWKVSVFLLAIVLCSCEEDTVWIPKPTGFLRRDFPVKEIMHINESNCPYEFDLVNYAKVLPAKGGTGCHKDIVFEDFNCEINFSYLSVDSNLFDLTEYVQKRINEHTPIAKAIVPYKIENDSAKTYGMYYRIDGDVALNGVFFITDSTNHFVSGLLSFNSTPNYDSLKPSLDYIDADIKEMMDSFRWLNEKSE